MSKYKKRVPGLVSLLLFMVLCAAVAYWAILLFKPPLRAVAAPPVLEQPQIDVSAAMGLFGRGQVVVAASNYQLLGVVAAKNNAEGVAIVSADGKPPQSVKVGKELSPGTSVKEVHSSYVLLSEGGILKRVMLPEDVRMKAGLGGAQVSMHTSQQAMMPDMVPDQPMTDPGGMPPPMPPPGSNSER